MRTDATDNFEDSKILLLGNLGFEPLIKKSYRIREGSQATDLH